MLIKLIKITDKKLGIFGTFILLIILTLGVRNLNVNITSGIPHVMSFNMYQHSISAKDGSEFPDIILKIGDDEFPLTKEQIAKTTMGYLHLSDRWKFYPKLYKEYFCSETISDFFGYDPQNSELTVLISYIKNYEHEVIFEERFLCQN